MSSEKLYTRSQVLEAMRLAVASEKLAGSPTILSAVNCGGDVPVEVLRFLGLEVVGKKFRRCAGASVDTADAAGVSGGLGGQK